MLFETCAREELNKLAIELYVHAAGGKRFKFAEVIVSVFAV